MVHKNTQKLDKTMASGKNQAMVHKKYTETKDRSTPNPLTTEEWTHVPQKGKTMIVLFLYNTTSRLHNIDYISISWQLAYSNWYMYQWTLFYFM